MLELFQMWALVEALGLLCLPLTMTVFHNLPDRGWAFSKAIGVALLAFCVWLPLMVLHFLPFTQLFIAGIVLILLAINLIGYVRMRHAIAKIVRLNLSYIALTEIIFLGMVFLLGYMRSYLPDIRSYEMYMDEGFITAIMRSTHFPPNDMWFAGYSINYYYYAHFTVATLAKLLGQSPSIAFNTGISMFFGLTASNLFGVTSNIVAWARHIQTRTTTPLSDTEIERPDTVHPSLLPAAPYGVLTMVMGLVLGNLASTQTWWKMHGDVSQDPYYWFNATRVITKTINEFPAFSFLLSCFHAHVLALAFTIVAIGLAFNLFLETDGRGLNVFGHGWRLPLTLGTTALILGGLYTMNGWDFPTYLALTLVCIALQQWLTYDTRMSLALFLDIFTAAGSLIALSFLLYIPFYLGFNSPAQGIGIVGAADRSQLSDEILIYGLFAFMFLSFLFVSAAKRPLFAFSLLRGNTTVVPQQPNTRRSWWPFVALGIVAVVELLTLVLLKNSITFVLAASIALLGAVLFFVHIGDRAHAFTLLLGAVAFALVAFCEVLFLKDVFADSYPRMNTVFKMYFQAWALLSITSGVGLYFILQSFKLLPSIKPSLRGVRRGLQAFWGVGLLLLLLAGIIYPLTAPSERLARSNPKTGQPYLQRSNSLDGLSYLQTDSANPGDYKAIRWLNENVQGDPVIIESIGNDYSNSGRISVFTGLPTLMGWVGHEYQWRANWINTPTNSAEFQRRGADVDTIYTNTQPNVVLSVMNYYHAQYLYVGPLEYMKYHAVDLHRFGTYMQVVYNTDGVTIYKIR
ncbi:MAG: DUF2298 domain-containing protein [Ktedonobacteraceae bacterium]